VRVVTFKLDEETLYILDRLSITLGKSRSEVIREALMTYVGLNTNHARFKVFNKVIRLT
jgi:Ribbon-helix-helix protein, copG family.